MDRIRLLLIHLIARAVGVNMAYEVRFLSSTLSVESKTGLLLRLYSRPSQALAELDRIKHSRSEPNVEGHYFIQVKARFSAHYYPDPK